MTGLHNGEFMNRMTFAGLVGLFALAFGARAAVAPPQIPLDDFIKHPQFLDVKISPTGEYLAATVMATEDTGALVILRRSDMQMTGSFRLRGKTFVGDFEWANDERIVFSVAEKDGALSNPRGTGELYATNWDGKKQEVLIGANETLSAARKRTAKYEGANLVDTLFDDDKHVLISVFTRGNDEGTYPTLERLNIYTKARSVLARAPVLNAQYVVDQRGEVRFALGQTIDNRAKLFYRDGNGKDWRLVNDEAVSELSMQALGFTADGKRALIESEERTGPNALYEWDPATSERKQIARDDNVDPAGLVFTHDFSRAFGVVFWDGTPRAQLLDTEVPEAKLWKSLSASFPGQWVSFRSFTKDASEVVFRVSSDRNPGEFYLLDKNHKATYLLSTRKWIDPEQMAEIKPITYQARDGVTIEGFLTLPKGSSGKNLPLILNPHGGPIGPFDDWFYNPEVQLFANRGYAVLQVNYRGSGNYGRAFRRSGYREWGGKMIDDMTDGVNHLVKQGIVDPNRMCIYGASYGGYASGQAIVREPDMYKCSFGYVGVYDMPMMYSEGDIPDRDSGVNYLEEILGTDRAFLASISPSRNAEKIKTPMFIAVGNDDFRAHPKHSRAMRKALEDAGKVVKWMEKDYEGHGYFKEENKRDLYTQMLAWFDQYIGAGAKPAAPAGAP